MKNILYIMMSFILLNSTSCCWGLDELPVFDEADIISVSFETRWTDSETGRFNAQSLSISNMVIDNNSNLISLNLSVPDASSNFPDEIRNFVNLDKIVMTCKLSNAAIIKPLGSSPPLGTIGNFSQDNLQYEVVAADGKTKKTWTINIIDFIK